MTIQINDQVLFGRDRGEQTRGTVVGMTRGGKYKVRQDEARGRYPVGGLWTIPAGLLRPAGAGPSRTAPRPTGVVVGARVAFTHTTKGRIEGTVARVNARSVTLKGTSDGHPVGWRVAPSLLSLVEGGEAASPPASSTPAPEAPAFRPGDRVAWRGREWWNPSSETVALHGYVTSVDIARRTYSVWRPGCCEVPVGFDATSAAPPRSRDKALDDIGAIYLALSPEHLSADGERPRHHVQRLRALYRRLLGYLFREVGRTVGETEAFDHLDASRAGGAR